MPGGQEKRSFPSGGQWNGGGWPMLHQFRFHASCAVFQDLPAFITNSSSLLVSLERLRGQDDTFLPTSQKKKKTGGVNQKHLCNRFQKMLNFLNVLGSTNQGIVFLSYLTMQKPYYRETSALRIGNPCGAYR